MATTIAGIRIRERRRAVGITQATLAERMGISASYLNLIERNKRGIAGHLIRRAADELDLRVEDLDGSAERRLIDQLRDLSADPRLRELSPETELAGEFTGRYPGWARTLSALARSERESSTLADALADRLTHDPFLGESVHKMLTHIAALRSISEILETVPDVGGDQLRRFHAILADESMKLSEVGEALAAYFDKAHTDARAVTPLDEVEALFEDHANRFDAIEADGLAAIDAILLAAPQMNTASARSRARRALEDYARDVVATGPAFAERARMAGYDLDLLVAQTGLEADVICRRLTALPEDQPQIGYLVANAAGSILDLRPIPGFHPTRGAGLCPLWILARAAQVPGRAHRQLVGFPNGQRFVFVARARPTGIAKFGTTQHYLTDMMILSEEDAAKTVYAPNSEIKADPVGLSCRICPRESCLHRVGDPISG
ncbi:MAG: short-chain fatty acyl-CoA regulator family protein [Pseudomonadota bacterium]